MTLPVSDAQSPVHGHSHRTKAPAAWSFTASTGPREDDNVLVVLRISVDRLGMGDLTTEVAASSGPGEALRWQRARVREYVTRLREQLRLHLATSEVIVHADEGASDDHLQVIATVASGDATETARLEQEIAERVEAIAKHAWLTWSEGLRVTMASLRALEPA
jgi:hypothetical protein